MDARKIFRTPAISEQVLLLLIEKKKISRKALLEIICTTPEKRHAINNAIYRLRKNGQIIVSAKNIEFVGSIPEKKKYDQIWDALRNSPSLTLKELVCITAAKKVTVSTFIQELQKRGLVRTSSYSLQPTKEGYRRVAHYTLIDKDMERPRWKSHPINKN